MRSVLTGAACIGSAILSGSVPLLAQLRDNSEKQLTCANGGNDNDRARHCEIREQNLPSIGSLNIDAGQNGGVTVKGWLRQDVLVRARIEASAETESAAAIMAGRVMIDASGGQVRAAGPDSENNSWWSVSYEIFVPQATDLTLKTHNGGVTVSDVRGHLNFEGLNGGVHLKRVAGEISGRTVNGASTSSWLAADWMRGKWSSARPMAVSRSQCRSTIQSFQTETGMGRVQSDFPLPADTANARSRRMDFTIGSGGPPIHITTGNGSIRLKRLESQ